MKRSTPPQRPRRRPQPRYVYLRSADVGSARGYQRWLENEARIRANRWYRRLWRSILRRDAR